MAITVTSRKYTDNLRKLRRMVQGRGVNLRATMVSGVVYADERITVPGLHSDDPIAFLFNMSDLVDIAGYLDDGAVAAAATFGSSDGVFTVTALEKGTDGNKIALKAVTGTGISSPLSVQIGPRDLLFGETGHSGWTGILVTLATNGSGTLDTTDPNGPNSANNVRAAILDAQESPAQESIVDVTISSGNGEDPVGDISSTPLTGGLDFDQGPSTASLDTSEESPYGSILFTATSPGRWGNIVTVTITAGGSLGVSVSDEDITVTYVVGVTTVQDVIDAVNGNADAAKLVVASPARFGASGANEDASLLVETLAQTNLSGGVDPGIQLSVASSGKTILVGWFTRMQTDEGSEP